jgi:hypothetical protein
MADQKVKITFEIDGLKESVTSIDDAKSALKNLETQAKKSEAAVEDTSKELKNMGKNSEEAGKNAEGATKIIDEAFGGIGTKVKEVGGSIKQLGSSAVTSFKSAVTGANAMGKALIATGIGAIVVALGLIAAYWDDIVGAISGVSADQKQLLADTEATADANKENLAATEASENSLKLAGKSEKEIRDLKIQQTNEIINSLETQLVLQKEQSDAQAKALQRNKDISQNVIRLLGLPVTILLGAVDELTKALALVGVLDEGTNLEEAFSGGLAGLIFDPESAKEEGDKAIAEIDKQLTTLKNKRDGYILQTKESNQKAAEDSIQTERELLDELARLQAENITDAEQRQLALLELQRQRARQELIDKGANNQLLLELDKNYQTQKQEIIDGFKAIADEKEAAEQEKFLANRQMIDELLQQANLDSIENTFERSRIELEIQKNTDLEKLRLAGATEAEINRIKAGYTKKNKKLDKEEADFKKALRKADVNNALQAGSDVLGSIVNLVGEGSAVGKAAAVAQTTIDTYKSATAAYASTVGIPVVGPVLAPIAAGVAVASGIMSVKKILSTKIPSAGGGGKATSSGGGGGAVPSLPSTPSAPQFDPNAAIAANTAGVQPDNQLTLGEQQGSTGANVVKAYVVSSEMTNQQEADAKINDLASL